MVTYKIIAAALAFVALISALIAAWYWWRASRLRLTKPTDNVRTTFSPLRALMAKQTALTESDRLMAKAVIWTSAAILSAVAAILSAQ